MTRITIYDTTLRDGSQGEGVNFSLQDKLNITRRLDELGVDFIEGGYPLSNPKDFEYFQEVRKLPLQHAKVAAFGMTRRKGVGPAEDDVPQGAARRPDAGRHHRRQDVGHARPRGAGTQPGRKPAHDRRLGGLLQGGRPRGLLRRRALLRRLRRNPRLRPANAAGGPGRRGVRGHPVRHQRRHAAGRDRRRRGRRPGGACAWSSASTATTTATWPWPTRWRRGARGDAGAGHDQRHRRALRQRRPGKRHRQPGPEARPRGACSRAAWPG